MKWGQFKQIVELNGITDDADIDFIDASLTDDQPVMVMNGALGFKIMTDFDTAAEALTGEMPDNTPEAQMIQPGDVGLDEEESE
jgi:hypothetical protein